MQPVSPNARRYDVRTIAFHWATVVLVAAQWVLAQVIDDFAPGAPRVAARSTPILLGLVIAAVIIGRVVWRATQGRRLPAADQGALHVTDALEPLRPARGGTVAWHVYSLGAGRQHLWPAYMPSNPDLGDQVAGVHGTVVTVLMILAGVHATAALVHQYVWRDGLLRRMLTRRSREHADH